MNRKTITISAIAILGILAICGACVFFGLFAAILGADDTGPEIVELSTVREEPTPDLLLFSEIREEQGDLTQLQWEEYRASLKDQHVAGWTGLVSNVQEESLGDRYYVSVRMDSGRYHDDVFLYVDRDTALSLEKDRRIVFSGTVFGTSIRLIRSGFAVELDDVDIEYAD